MALISISEAIRLSPVGRTRFYSHYIKEGIITVSVDETGKKCIDTSELLRVFKNIKLDQKEETAEQVNNSVNTPDTSTTNNTEQPKTEESELVKLLREQLEKAEQREQQHLKQIEALTLRLEPPRTAKQPNPFMRWWNGLEEKNKERNSDK